MITFVVAQGICGSPRYWQAKLTHYLCIGENNFSDDLLFVIGGLGGGMEGREIGHKTEIVSLTDNMPIPGCLNSLADHPNNIFLGAGGALPEAGKRLMLTDR